MQQSYSIEAIGIVRSELKTLEGAPLQGDEGGIAAWLELEPRVAQGIVGIKPGQALMLLTWLHRAGRDVLQVHPRGDTRRPVTGVFATRSQDRPNPIGLHRVTVIEVADNRIKVAPLEAIDGTPIVDIKVALRPTERL